MQTAVEFKKSELQRLQKNLEEEKTSKEKTTATQPNRTRTSAAQMVPNNKEATGATVDKSVDTTNYFLMQIHELRFICKERRLPVSGLKKDIVARLQQDDAKQQKKRKQQEKRRLAKESRERIDANASADSNAIAPPIVPATELPSRETAQHQVTTGDRNRTTNLDGSVIDKRNRSKGKAKVKEEDRIKSTNKLQAGMDKRQEKPSPMPMTIALPTAVLSPERRPSKRRRVATEPETNQPPVGIASSMLRDETPQDLPAALPSSSRVSLATVKKEPEAGIVRVGAVLALPSRPCPSFCLYR